eukprot:1181588-Prorocentrum_minimum.AAC.6
MHFPCEQHYSNYNISISLPEGQAQMYARALAKFRTSFVVSASMRATMTQGGTATPANPGRGCGRFSVVFAKHSHTPHLFGSIPARLLLLQIIHSVRLLQRCILEP